MKIRQIENLSELDKAISFIKETLSPYALDRDALMREMKQNPNLLLYMADMDKIAAAVFGTAENNKSKIDYVCTDKAYRRQGFAKKLMEEMLHRLRVRGFESVALGASEMGEKFYEEMGFVGKLLIQSERHSVEELLSLKTKYPVASSGIWKQSPESPPVSQVVLSLSQVDRDLQRLYEKKFPDCSTQMIYTMQLSRQ
ncbi:MAG: GNAT family N-acetyltransferase [Alphaproteobacteria bacterium]|nr:GNAT family N-acetyltransferase [Alphaproteobacteria bacterium]MCL2757738.1 GNAT family N-acetyltransferase [Alphaproteobacteria bacterium]